MCASPRHSVHEQNVVGQREKLRVAITYPEIAQHLDEDVEITLMPPRDSVNLLGQCCDLRASQLTRA